MKNRLIIMIPAVFIIALLFFIDGIAQTKNSDIWLIKPQYELAGDFSDGLAKIKKNRKFGYINKEGKIVIEPKYDVAGDFSEGLAGVKNFSEPGNYIDKEGKVIISNPVDKSSQFNEGIARVSKNFKYGFINKEGKIIIDIQFDDANDFSNGYAAVKSGDKWGFIDKNGKIIVEPQYSFVENFSEGYAYVLLESFFKGEERFIIDKDGKRVYILENATPTKWKFSEGLAAVRDKSGKEGFIDKNFKYVIEPTNILIFDFSEGLARFCYREGERKYGYINREGKVVIEPKYNFVMDFSNGLARVNRDGKWGYIDKSGEVVIEPQFYIEGPFSEGIASVCVKSEMGSEWGFIKTPIPAKKQEETLFKAGQLIGEIKSMSGREIIVAGKNIAERVYMGDKLSLFSGDKLIILKSTFPMQTVTKCEILSGKAADIKPGMKVYKYRKQIRDE